MPSRKQFLLLARALGDNWPSRLNPRLGERRAHPFLSVAELLELPGVKEALGPDEPWTDIDGKERLAGTEERLANMLGQASCFPVPWCVSDGDSYHGATEAGCFARPENRTLALPVPGVLTELAFTEPGATGRVRRLFLGSVPEIERKGDVAAMTEHLGPDDLAILVCHYCGDVWSISREAAHFNDTEASLFTDEAFGFDSRRSRVSWTTEEMVRAFAHRLVEDPLGVLPPWSGDLGPWTNKRGVVGWHVVPRLLSWLTPVGGWHVTIDEVSPLSAEAIPVRAPNPETGKWEWIHG